MSRKEKKSFYAYFIDGEQGIVGSWPECEALTRGRPARYRGFPTMEQAEAWLAAGARYEDKAKAKREAQEMLPVDGIYFDAGTGRGKGTEARVTDREGTPLTFLALEEEQVTPEGNLRLKGRTNNFGELTAFALAVEIALKMEKKEVLGDSRLVVEYWSKGHVSKKMAEDNELLALARRAKELRSRFERAGGRVTLISGGVNPADLGFHRD